MIKEISIIIPTLNEANYLPGLLQSLVKQTYKGAVQVIVVDGKSDDSTPANAELFSDRINIMTVNSERDIGMQRNIGVQHAVYENILFLDADVILPPNLITNLCSRVDDRSNFVATVLHVFSDLTISDRFFALLGYSALCFFRLRKMIVLNGDFIFTTQEVHRSIGGFKENVLIGEDVDYGKRAVSAGAQYKFYWKLHVIASIRRAKMMGRWRLLKLWYRLFFKVYKNGPIYKNEGVEYNFGNYPPIK